MKSFLIASLLLSSLSGYAQVFTGGDRLLKDPFEFTITAILAKESRYITFSQSSNSHNAFLMCDDEGNRIQYQTRGNKTVYFTFDNADKCLIFRGCLQLISKPTGLNVQVDRTSLKVTKVNLPAECSQDPLAEE